MINIKNPIGTQLPAQPQTSASKNQREDSPKERKDEQQSESHKHAKNSRPDIDSDRLERAGATSQETKSDSRRKIQLGMQAHIQGAIKKVSKSGKLKANLLSMTTKSRSPSPVTDFIQDKKAAITAYENIKRKGEERGDGLTDFLVKGSVAIPKHTDEVWLQEGLQEAQGGSSKTIKEIEKTQVIPLSVLNFDVIVKFYKLGKLGEFLDILAGFPSRTIYMKNEKIELNDHLKQKHILRQQISLRNSEGEHIDKHASKVFKVNAATALSLRALYEKRNDIFALMVGEAPSQIMNKIVHLPFAGNIFSDSALLALLGHLTPKTNRYVPLDKDARNANAAIGACISHYFQFSPLLDLKPAVNSVMGKLQPELRRQDLLLHNPKVLLRELALLLDRIISMDYDCNHRGASLEQATEAGWQSATLVGNVFKYVHLAADRLELSQSRIVSYIGWAVNVAESATHIGSSFAGPAAGADGILDDVEKSIGDRLAQKVVQTNPELDLDDLTRELALLSDRLKGLANAGFLAPGLSKVTKETRDEFNDPKSRLRTAHKIAGSQFLAAYSAQLANFSERQLESEARKKTKNIK